MAGISLEQAQTQLDLYLSAEAKVLTGQSYEIAGRKLTRANLAEIQTGITAWSERVNQLTQRAAGRGRTRTVVVRG